MLLSNSDHDYQLLLAVRSALRQFDADVGEGGGSWRHAVDDTLRGFGLAVDEALQEQYANSAHPTGHGPLVILSNGHAIWERDAGLEITQWETP